MDPRKRKRVATLPTSAESPAGMVPSSPYDASPASSHPSSTMTSPCSPSPSYHLPQFLASSPDPDCSPMHRDGHREASMEASSFSSGDEHSTSIPLSPSASLSCGESSLNASLLDDDRYTGDRLGDETPSERCDDSLSQSTCAWGEDSVESFGEPSPSSSLSSSMSSLSSSAFLEDLSILGSVLSDDIYHEVRRKEEDTPALQIDQEYHKTRPILVDWMLDVGDYFGFHGATTHLAVAYLDRMLSMMSIERNKLQLVATACLLIAAKLEEIPNKVPTVTEFNDRTLDTYSADLIRTCERVVLNHLGWNLLLTTPRSMLDFFLAEVSCVSYDDLIRGVPLSYDRSQAVEDWAIATAHSVMTMIVLDHQFLRFRPSILAAVCLAVARRQARIEPLWPARLERKTGFSLDEIADCFNFTWSMQESALAKQAGTAQEAMET